ncbi:YlbF/YmcA family competence regulator [Streptococcus devriesei]|uniref:YlbF/YmcA family competence regulator n=1 Tax=Streptococcus devriesei TaxID=231233 RepID=UPI000413983D|nr:YlbF/YmcA family competence regulator [Streptococcus devriesei]
MSVNVYDLANELERGIRSLPEYQSVADAKVKVDADPQASALLKEFVDFQTKLQSMAQAGQLPTKAHQEEMQELSQRIEANAVLKPYFDAQQALSVYMTDIERIIFQPMKDLM